MRGVGGAGERGEDRLQLGEAGDGHDRRDLAPGLAGAERRRPRDLAQRPGLPGDAGEERREVALDDLRQLGLVGREGAQDGRQHALALAGRDLDRAEEARAVVEHELEVDVLGGLRRGRAGAWQMKPCITSRSSRRPAKARVVGEARG